MLCILDNVAKSWIDPHFIPIDSSKLILPEKLKKPTINFIKLAEKVGLFYPTIKINNEHIELKYDCDNRYVIFSIYFNQVKFTFGLLKGTPTTDILNNCTEQLIAFSHYVYGNM